MEISSNRHLSRYLKLSVITLSVSFGLMAVVSDLSFAREYKKIIKNKSLNIYSGSDISAFFEDIGYGNFWTKGSRDIGRNSDGSALIFYRWYKNKAIVVSCDGLIKEIDLPENIYWNSGAAYFDKEYQVVAWRYAQEMHFRNGITRNEVSTSAVNTDPARGYYLKDSPSTLGTEIFSIERPEKPIAKISKFHGRKIYFKGGKVFIFGNYYIGGDTQLVMHVFECKGQELMHIEKRVILRPNKSPDLFYVVDFSSWDDEVLFIDIHDLPFRSEWYVYNLKTHKMKRLGKLPFSGGYGFYLQCDIIKKAAEKYKRDRSSQ